MEYRTAFRVADIPSMLELIAHGLAIGFLPQTATDSQPGIRFVPLSGFSPTCIAAVITADRPTSVATRSFLDTLGPATSPPDLAIPYAKNSSATAAN